MKKNLFLKLTAILLMPLLLFSIPNVLAADTVPVNETAADDTAPVKDTLALDCKSAILMEASTGRVLYEQNADEALPPASVTKVMTLLLVMEAIESGKIKLDDMVTTSSRAASMGGSQIYLEEGEQMSVEDMIKSVVIASANDAACALAEFVSGSEEEFVKAMNTRAKELGMTSAVFENTNGLDDTAENHVISARDIAIMSSKLIGYEKILEYSSIWMDTVRNGEFGLTNTNRLVRYYSGCTGLKTGSTSKAGFCISATAERNGLSLVCVIMGAETRDIRNAAATRLLDWGFANYSVYTKEGEELDGISVTGGTQNTLKAKYNDFSCVTDKSLASKIEYKTELPDTVTAPIKEEEKIGEVVFTCDGKEIGRADIIATEEVKKIGYFDVWLRMLGKYLLK
ncbi:MAG: D-alanyl-D-alanine carboxypeptidase [Clostridia bacterium]|nr:D-alanyl-D-alanine carboxypeptidase [Clostridia bacterium]